MTEPHWTQCTVRGGEGEQQTEEKGRQANKQHNAHSESMTGIGLWTYLKSKQKQRSVIDPRRFV
jgi:hypothetical protein